jgi:hypothetical protein
MAHRMARKPQNPPLSTEDIILRLRAAFQHVDASNSEGAAHVQQMIDQFVRMDAPQEIIEKHKRMKENAVRILACDDLDEANGYLRFVLIPGEDVLIGYQSVDHEERSRPLLDRCLLALDYSVASL